AQILDVRDPTEFAAAHMVGTVNIGLKGQYAIWCGSILSRERQIVIVADPDREQEAATRLCRIGFDNIAGYLEGGMLTLEKHADLIRRTERVTATELAERLASNEPPVVLDVRSEREWQSKHIEGSLNIPLNKLADRLKDVPQGKKIIIHCAAGYRSSIAASILRLHEVADAPDLIGGIAAWEAAKPAVVTGDQKCAVSQRSRLRLFTIMASDPCAFSSSRALQLKRPLRADSAGVGMPQCTTDLRTAASRSR